MITRKSCSTSRHLLLNFVISSSLLLLIIFTQTQLIKCDSSSEPSHPATDKQEHTDAHTSHHESNSNRADDSQSGGELNEPCDHCDDQNDPELLQKPNELQAIRLNDTSVVLRWESDHLPLQHLQFFKVQYKSTKKDATWKTDNHEIAPQVKAYQINGLRPGNYFFKVQAVYDNDDSVSSDQIKYRLRAKTKIAPHEWPELKAPEIYWHEERSDYLRFKWKYNFKQSDFNYFGYLVYYRSAYAMSDFTIYNTLDENVEIADLEPETPYEVKVVAYNSHTVSNFSDIKRVKTLPKPNSTTTPISLSTSTLSPSNARSNTTVAPSTTTTKKPIPLPPSTSTTIENLSTGDVIKQPPVGPTVQKTGPTDQVTQKPTTTLITNPANNVTSTQSISSTISDLFFGGPTDSTMAIRYSLLVLSPILFIVFASLCLISCRHNRHKDPPPPTTHDSMQFALEINGYFKNSFPNVENEYLPTTNHDAKHGFVNNHPHIHDFA